jgi:phage gp16-like protein
VSALRAIHGARRRIGLDEDTYRDVLERVTGKRSLRAMNEAERRAVLNELNGDRPGATALLTGPYAKKCQALWIAGWNLGVFRDRTDAAMLTFIKRQTGIENMAWLRDAGDAKKVIEALKSWIAREGDVDWHSRGPRDYRDEQDRIIEAQARLLGLKSGDVVHTICGGLPKGATGVALARAAKMAAMNVLGERVREKIGASR